MVKGRGFKPGRKKTGGKKKGSKNKRTLEWEEFGKQLLEFGLPRAMAILETAPPDKFMPYFDKMLEYFKPRLSRTEMKGDISVNLPQVYLPNNGR